MNLIEYCDYAARNILGLELKGRMWFPKGWNDEMANDPEKEDLVIQRASDVKEISVAYFRPDLHYVHFSKVKKKISPFVEFETDCNMSKGFTYKVISKEDPAKNEKVHHPNWKLSNLVGLVAIVNYYEKNKPAITHI